MSDRVGDWMQTHTGRAFWPLDPRQEEIDIEDIAHALAQQNRYAGHCPWPYSVAQHSVLVSRLAEMGVRLPDRALNVARWGLLHDATEAYLVDVPRPIKQFLGGYQKFEAELMRVIAQRFGLPGAMPYMVKTADDDLLATEAATLFPVRPLGWHLNGVVVPYVSIISISWEQAKADFLARFRELFPEDR